MNDDEAGAVIAALKSGKQFEFESYAADAREVLAFDRAAGAFLFTTYHAYDPEAVETRVFAERELAAWLRETFAYRDFGLPPVPKPHGRFIP